VTDKRILFGEFEFPVEKGLEYLINENVPETDFLLINEPCDTFSMTFEKDFPIFTVPPKSDRDYFLFEQKRKDRVIKFFCPEKHENLNSAVWYFCVELFDESGEVHTLPGQVRVEFDGDFIRQAKGKPQFIEILEGIKLNLTCT
jgi:hypothetical protein